MKAHHLAFGKLKFGTQLMLACRLLFHEHVGLVYVARLLLVVIEVAPEAEKERVGIPA